MDDLTNVTTPLDGVTADTTAQTDADAQQGAEKTFTQAEVDKIVKDRTWREKEKYKDYYEIKADVERFRNDSMTLKELSEVLNVADVPGTPTEQVKALQASYGITKKEAQAVVNTQTDNTAVAFMEATKFSRTASDIEVVEEIERILETPVNKRQAVDNEKLEALKDRFSTIKWKEEYTEAETWFKANGEGELKEIIDTDDFKEFAADSKASFKVIIEKYLKYTGKPKQQPYSPGSVKDSGGQAAKDYYSSAEVDKLTPKQLDDPKIMAVVRKSMTQWK